MLNNELQLTYNFNVETVTNDLINWIKEFFNENGKDCNAVIGISGGKDSTISAALCVRALGKDRVIGILMPNGSQKDINDSYEVCELLGIKYYEHNIEPMITAYYNELNYKLYENTSKQTMVNLPARIRMTVLYAYSQSLNGRVVNNCNQSENWVGYSTRYGDAAGDFGPLQHLTVTELKQIGDYLGLPHHLIHKVPADGLCDKTDEDNLGFSYSELDDYIRKGISPSDDHKKIIDKLHEQNKFKLQLMPTFKPNLYLKKEV